MNGAPSAGQGRTSPRTAIQAVAAILLVLHWILPGAWLAGPVQPGRGLGLGDLGPGYVSGLWASQPLNLPRLQPRTASLESSHPNRGEPFHVPGGKVGVLPDVAGGIRLHEPARPLAAAIAGAIHSAAPNAFDARGPPIPA